MSPLPWTITSGWTFGAVKASDGIWAPCLSWDGEYFYLIYTVVRDAREFPVMDTPNYLIRAKKLTGPWSDPVY